jgi:outer membrane protein assembly factor BamA
MAVIALTFNSCSLRRNIPSGEHLIGNVKVKGEPKTYSEDVYSLLKTKPNKKFLGVRLNMWFYLFAKKRNILTKKEEKLKKDLWEEPSLVDTSNIEVSASQINAFLFNKGFFDNKVSYKVRKNRIPIRHRIRNVVFKVDPGSRYYIHKLSYNITDKNLSRIFQEHKEDALISEGVAYDGDKLSLERERVTALFRNNGYLNFSREYIYFDVDTSLSGDQVNIGFGILNPTGTNHKIFKVGSIFVQPEYLIGDSSKKDTIIYGGINYISSKLVVKPSILSDFIFYEPGKIFEARDYQNTINRLSQIGIFKFIDIQYIADSLSYNDSGRVNIYIKLSPELKQAYQYSIGLNTREENQLSLPNSNNRTLGTALSFEYQHKNIARSALQLSIGPRLSYEIPINRIGTGKKIVDSPTVEYGATASLSFPELLFPFKVNDLFLRLSTATSLNLNYLNEHNKNYRRTTFNMNLSYQIRALKVFHYVTPVELNIINANIISTALRNYVTLSGNPLILNFFEPHIISDMRYTFLVNQQPFGMVDKKYLHFRNSIESGGNILTGIDLLTNKLPDIKRGTGRIFNVQYYQYIREEADLRFYMPVWHYSNLAIRGILGLGVPYFNSTILPYERRFLIGGNNSVRAWPLGLLGPGTYSGRSFDHSGDFKIETNAELRFPIYGIFKGALFMDAGNVWTYQQDTTRPGSQFKADSFYKQFALGAGLGLRFDFNFFIIRVDLAVPVRDPSLPAGQRYVIGSIWRNRNVINSINWNLGVGYPF